jgi:hypothetical protein
LEESFPQVVEKSVDKFPPYGGKQEKVFLYKRIFPLSAGCGKLRGKPCESRMPPVEKRSKIP